MHFGPELSPGPALEKAAGDSVADFKSCGLRANSNNFSGPVRKRDAADLWVPVIEAPQNDQVTIVERCGPDPNKDFAISRLWRRLVDDFQAIRATVGLDRVNFHWKDLVGKNQGGTEESPTAFHFSQHDHRAPKVPLRSTSG